MLLEISLRYCGVMRERGNITQKSNKAKFTSAEGHTTDKEQASPSGEPTGVVFLMECCPSPELGRSRVHSLHSWLVGKRTSGGVFEDKEVSKLREATTVLGYQLQNQGI
jgi:hypothetical protein